jgi:MscS family membrane protein
MIAARATQALRRALVWPLVLLALALVLAVTTRAVRAEPSAPKPSASQPSGGSPTSPEAEDADSPRAAVKRFVELARAGEHADAARLLDLPDGRAADGATLARRFKAVVDRYGPLDPSRASPRSSGDGSDKLPAGVDQVGTLRTPFGEEPLRMTRTKGTPSEPPRWVFSRSTVEQIDRWFSSLEDHWIHERLPPALTREGPLGLLAWQWLGLAVALVGAIAIGRVLGGVTRLVVRRVVTWRAGPDVELERLLRRPLRFFWAVAALYLLRYSLHLPSSIDASVAKVLRALFVVAVFWIALRVVEATSHRLLERDDGDAGERRAVVPLATITAKIAAFLMALAGVLAELGYQPTSIIAGLGIGGLGLALAAQKTVEHLFGSVSIGLDRPFKVGDFVKVEDVQGTVERIGLRSTRVRTLDRTLVTIPNGKLADMRIESFTARDRLRLQCSLGLVRWTRAEQVRAVVEGVRATLVAHEKVWPDRVVVVFKAIGDDALEVAVDCWMQTTDVDELAALRQELLLRFLEIIEAAGTSLAYPTRTVQVTRLGASGPR